MEITVDLPDDLAVHSNPGREALETLAIEGYRTAKLSHSDASQLLDMSTFEFDDFLGEWHIYDPACDPEDLALDRKTLMQMLAEPLPRR